jgi:hypothetical protein
VSFSNPPSSALKKILECYLCGQEHYARTCPLRKQAISNTKANSAVAQGYRLPADITDDPDHENSTYAAVALHKTCADDSDVDDYSDFCSLIDDDSDTEDKHADTAAVMSNASAAVTEHSSIFDADITTDGRLSNSRVRLANDYIQREYGYSMLVLAEDIALFERVDDKDLMYDLIDAACSALYLVGHRREEVIFCILDIIEDLRIVPLSPTIDNSEGK